MTDESPGKVQALRAIFSEKNNPVMGLIPPGSRIPSRPWRAKDDNTQESIASKENKLNDVRLGNRVLPVRQESPPSLKETRPVVHKPVVGPKPSHLVVQQQFRAASPENIKSNGSVQRTFVDPSKSRSFGETIASFMFNNKENENISSSNTPAPPLPPLPKPRISQIHNREDVLNFTNSQNCQELDNRCRSVICSDNYICKVRRKELPSKEKLGPAPLKPTRAAHFKLPSSVFSSTEPSSELPKRPASSQRPSSLQRPSYPCPPRPVTSPPLPPISAPVIKPAPTTLREEIEELYEDTLLGDKRRPVSLIPEYTEEEEEAELYNDAAESQEEDSSVSDSSFKYKKLPPPVPSEYLQPNVNGSTEELYQDADGITQEEFYEVMPCDEILEDLGSPLYGNNKREVEKLKKDEEKRIRREQKEKEKRDKELEKLKRKFGLTGDEIPIDDGLVKWNSRGGKNGDLAVKKGETVLILRMEGNPSGRWLVKNEEGKIGYVELTNIEVMSIRRLSVISAGEELYCEAKSEEEAIYEVTY